MKPQTLDIFNYMQEVGPITQLIALPECGCTRLPARIDEIRKELRGTGLVVKDKWVSHTNQRGQKKRYKAYWVEVAQ